MLGTCMLQHVWCRAQMLLSHAGIELAVVWFVWSTCSFSRDLTASHCLVQLLVNNYNAATVDGLMCRDTLSVGWDGRLYDCDFNQQLELSLRCSTSTI